MSLSEIHHTAQSGRDRRRKETPDEAFTRIFEATIGETARRYHSRAAARMEEEEKRAFKLRCEHVRLHGLDRRYLASEWNMHRITP